MITKERPNESSKNKFLPSLDHQLFESGSIEGKKVKKKAQISLKEPLPSER